MVEKLPEKQLIHNSLAMCSCYTDGWRGFLGALLICTVRLHQPTHKPNVLHWVVVLGMRLQLQKVLELAPRVHSKTYP